MRILLLLVSVLFVVEGAATDVPFPTCADSNCSNPRDFGSYLFVAPGQLPDLLASIHALSEQAAEAAEGADS